MQYEIQPPRRRRRRNPKNRTAEILTISILVALFVLFGIGAMLWAVRNQIAFAPTATPTATPAPEATPKPDIQATIQMEDMLTQIAYTAAEATLAFQALNNSQTATAVAIALIPEQPQSPLAESTNVILLPSISSGGDAPPLDPAQAAQETAMAAAQTPATSVALLPIISGSQPESPIDTPAETTGPEIPGTITETVTSETATPGGEATPTFTPEPPTATPTITPIIIADMSSRVVASAGAPLYAGIGSTYPVIANIGLDNTTLRLKGRNETGEWLLVCCQANVEYWTRSAFVRPQGNATPVGAPAGSVGDDIRWLPVVSVSGNPQPAPTFVPPPVGDLEYPQQYHDLRNSGRVPRLPSSYASAGQLPGGEASSNSAFASPLLAANGAIYGVSSDKHLYAFNQDLGGQRWKLNLGEDVTVAPAYVGNTIYLATQTGNIVAIQDPPSNNNILWNKPIVTNVAPATGVKVVGEKIFVGMSDNRLYAIDRASGTAIKSRSIEGKMFTPAIAGNTIYVAGPQLFALDVDDIDKIVWQRPLNGGAVTAPVYVSPGVKALAELFVADGAGRINVLNANTGEEKMLIPGFPGAVFLNVTGDYIIATSNTIVKAFSRADGVEKFSTGYNGGPALVALSSGSRLLLVMRDGQVILLDVAANYRSELVNRPAVLGGAPALSGLDLYAPGSNGAIYLVRGIQ